MKGGKEEEKAVGPLFPRLHVNDTEKGGPRAPPRNKMALYEQLSIPSQRFNPSAAASSLPLPPHKGGTSAPSNSSSQSYGHERNAFSPFHMPPHAPAHSAERVHSRSDGSNIDNIWKEHERRSRLHLDNSTSNARRSIAECSSLRPQNSSNGKNSSGKNFDDEDDFRVPTFVQSGIAAFSNKSPPAAERGKLNPSCGSNPQKNYSVTFNSSIQFLNSNEKSSKHDMVARNDERNHSREKPAIKDSAELSESQRESGEKFTEPSNFAKMALDQGHRGTDTFENFCSGDAELFPESCGNGAVLTDVDVVEKMDALRARKEPCSRASLRNSHNSPNTTKKGHQEIVMKANKSLELGDTDKNDEVSDTSMEDSMSEREISPDVVVGVIGPKHFWKARRAIINQQRVFAVQVFELHRLIKVQKLIAASPDVLDGHHHLSSSPTEELYKSLPPQLIGKSFLQSEKPSKSNEYFEENTVEDQPLPAHGDNINKEPPCQIPRTLRCSGDPPTGPMTSSNQPNPWCFHPPPNQWLVPVLSPSEGLIYKPYSGPCPPTGGFMAPMYGGCAPLGLPPMAKDFMSAAYSVPLSHQQHNVGLPPNYFPSPNGLPVVNPALSFSAVDQVNALTVSCPNGQHSRSSCNISNPRREASSGHRRKFQASRDSEVQGSTASSPCEKAQGEGNGALPLFPVAPAAGSCGQDKQSSRLIRVVPHNARSATASAARIFRSIQEERQQYDL